METDFTENFENWGTCYEVQCVEPVEMDKMLYRQDIWGKVLTRLMKKKLSATDYNILYNLNIEEFVQDIENGNFSWGTPKKVYIPKDNGKKRTVYMFGIQQRALLSVLNAILCEVFSDKISSACYSYKTGVTTMTAVTELKEQVCDYALKMDISKYFNSVKMERIIEMLNNLFTKDKRGVIYELLRVLFTVNEAYDNGLLVEEYLSLIPGCATASFFANYCLYDIDEHFKQEGIPYARYCDDIIVFANDKETLQGYVEYIEAELQKSGLCINGEKFCEFDLNSEDVEFLGLKFNAEKVDISEKSFVKLKKKIKHACKMARHGVWANHNSALMAVREVIEWFNYLWYKCYVFDKSKFGWGYYAFRFINTDETIKQLDFYLRDMLRYVYTGKHNKANIRKLPNEKLQELGYVSLTKMYGIFKSDYDVYLDTLTRM